jgi:hypothetical protein
MPIDEDIPYRVNMQVNNLLRMCSSVSVRVSNRLSLFK